MVTWSWGKGKGKGKAIAIYPKKVTKIIKDTEITRNGTEENPAILVQLPDGTKVLKLKSELSIDY